MSKGDPKNYVLRVDRNVYDQRQASRIWHKHLVNTLNTKLKFKQSAHDECVFYRGTTIYLLYTDDSMLAGPDEHEIELIINEIKASELDITVLGNLKDFLGVNISRTDDGRVHVSQPQLIKQIIDTTFQSKAIPRPTPAKATEILRRHERLPSHDYEFNYRSIIGKLNHLERGTRSDISYVTRQCARLCIDPKRPHVEAVRWLVRCLIGTSKMGYFINPKYTKGLEICVDAGFSGNWDPSAPEKERDTARSRHGHVIMYLGAPIV